MFFSFSKIQIICPDYTYQIRLRINQNSVNQEVYIINSHFHKVPDMIIVNGKEKTSINKKIIMLNNDEINSDVFIVFLSEVTNIARIFYNIHIITEIDFSHFKSSGVNYIEGMFEYCTGLKSLNLSNFDTSKVSSFNSMFKDCTSLTSLDLSNFVIKNNSNMEYMFYNCKNLEFINFKNAINCEYKENIFENTPNNLVMCFNKTNAPLLYEIFQKKACSNLDCSEDWKNNQNEIITDTGDCVQNKKTNNIENIDIEQTINNIIKNNETYLIKENIEKSNNNNIYNSMSNLYLNNCDIISYFENKCELNYESNEDTKQLISDLISQIKDGSLDDLLKLVVQKGQKIVRKELNEIYTITTMNNQDIKENRTIIDFGICENILKNAYNIDIKEELILFVVEQFIPGYKIPIIEYALFSKDGKINLDLNLCKNIKAQIYIPVSINENELYKYDPSGVFFNDRCNKYTTEHGTDITLYDRQKDYNDNNMSLCEANCDYKNYDYINKRVICECEIKNIKNFINNIKQDNLLNQFKNVKKILNIDILKCYKLLFTLEGLKANIGSYIIALIILFSIIISIYFCSKGYKRFNSKIKFLLLLKTKNKTVQFYDDNNILETNKYSKNKSNINLNKFMEISQNFNETYNKKNKIKNKNNMNKINKIITDNSNMIDNKKKSKIKLKKNNEMKILKKLKNDNYQLNDSELNSLSYKDALKIDKRDYLFFYLSLLKTKQILIFTFCLKSDYNSQSIKILLFLFSFSLFYSVNALFFTDSTMHQIYIDHGINNYIYQLPQIIYSSIISNLIENLIFYLSLTEDNIIELRQNNKVVKENIIQFFKCYKIKLIFFFIFDLLFLGIFWFYISIFCAVYTNTQICLLEDTIISLITSFAFQFFINLIPGMFRILALKAQDKDREYIYKISQLLQII